MYDQLATGFAQSPQGLLALQQLQTQGFAPPQANAMLAAAVPAAAEAMRGAAAGDRRMLNLGDSNYLMNFAAAAVSGLVRGEGFMGSAMDGLQGVVGGYVAQVIAARFGLPQRVAGLIGAVITPLAIDFLWERLAAGLGGSATAPAAAPPAPAAYGGYPAAAPAPAMPMGVYAQPAAFAAPPAQRGYGYAVSRAARAPAAHAYGATPPYTAPGYRPAGYGR